MCDSDYYVGKCIGFAVLSWLAMYLCYMAVIGLEYLIFTLMLPLIGILWWLWFMILLAVAIFVGFLIWLLHYHAIARIVPNRDRSKFVRVWTIIIVAYWAISGIIYTWSWPVEEVSLLFVWPVTIQLMGLSFLIAYSTFEDDWFGFELMGN